ncbi:methylglyoxal reductase (NADPH-dependent) gre2 [Steccherinum ochraceum]|uniref:Methylglyoxal reductase (NADPH-dependent) gre2 n=1 Tax=Steccherinum ochraceum TaxID=92696 RepID=A0A4R0RBI5_9APHY|nr:methylglyoxal reductase (NADPH-dependent) gre2 [Steccherinum ochraceum]
MGIVEKGKVLVTGANGYIAMHVVDQLLKGGYSVRGTVRSESKIKYIQDYFKSYGDKLELVVVPDITKEGAFDNYVSDVDAIEHTASPFTMQIDDPNEVIAPAVAGTTSVLQSAVLHGKNVKRIVVTSSTGAVLEVDTGKTTFTEDDWNDQAIRIVEEKGSAADAPSKYRASKTLAERAAWKVAELHKDSFELTTICPPFVYGPPIHEINGGSEGLNQSLKDWFNIVLKGTKDSDKEFLAKVGSSWVDVRDVAKAHVLALKTVDAGGQRIIVSTGAWKWQDWINIARTFASEVAAGAADTYKPDEAVHDFLYNTEKAKRIFELDSSILISRETSVQDMLSKFKERNLQWP